MLRCIFNIEYQWWSSEIHQSPEIHKKFMTKEVGLSLDEIEDNPNVTTITAKLTGKISGDVFDTWFTFVTSQSQKEYFIGLVENRYFKAKRELPLWEPYDLVLTATVKESPDN